MTVTASGVVDATPRRTPMAGPATLAVSGTVQPPEVVAHVPVAAREGYDLVASLDLPVEGWVGGNVTDAIYAELHRDYPASFDRVAYYMELVGSSFASTNWVWTSMDAFADSVSSLLVPASAAASTAETAVTGLAVESNVSGISAGAGLSGTVQLTYGSDNAGSVMRVSTGGTALWRWENWKSFDAWAKVGLGGASQNGNAYNVRRLHVFVRPAAPASAAEHPAPASVVANVPEAAGYALLQDVTIDTTANNFQDATCYADHVVDRSSAFTGKSIRRVAYYLRYLDGDAEKWVWASFDPPSQNLSDIRVPDATSQTLATRVANLSVRSNVPGVRTGDGIQTGFVNFFGCTPDSGPYLGLPHSTANYDTIDYTPRGSGNWGCFIVGDWSANQFLLSVCGLTVKNASIAAGIGNNNGKSWIFNYTVSKGTYTEAKLYVLVQEGAAPSAPEYLYTIAEEGGKRACVLFADTVPDSLVDPAAFETYPVATIAAAERSPIDSREVILTFADPLAAGTTYTMANPGAANGVTTEPRKTRNRQFTVPSATLPAVLNATNVPDIDDYSLVYKFDIPSANSSCGTYGAPYALDKSRFVGDLAYDRIAYALRLADTGGNEQWAWASMDAWSDVASEIGIPSVRRRGPTFQKVTNLVVRHGTVGSATAPILTDGSFAEGNIEFFLGNYSEGDYLNLGSSGGYDFSDWCAQWGAGGYYNSLQVHSFMSKQTVLAVNTLGGQDGWGVAPPGVGIGNMPNTENTDWTFAQNAGSWATRELFVFVRPTAADADNGPAFALQPQGARTRRHGAVVTLTAYAPTAVSHQWRKDGEPVPGATTTTLEVDPEVVKEGVFEYVCVATDAAGRSAQSAPAIVTVNGAGTVITLR